MVVPWAENGTTVSKKAEAMRVVNREIKGVKSGEARREVRFNNTRFFPDREFPTGKREPWKKAASRDLNRWTAKNVVVMAVLTCYRCAVIALASRQKIRFHDRPWKNLP